MTELPTNIRWLVFQRKQEVAAELRVAVIRLAAIMTFFGIHLYAYMSTDAASDAYQLFHQRLSFICVVWCMVSIAVFIGARFQTLPQWVKYLTVGCDLLFLTSIALLDYGGNSYEVILYPLIVATCTLRFSNQLICYGTALATICFLLLVGKTDSVWFDSHHVVPIVNTLMTIACVFFTGVVGWQVVNSVRRLIANVDATAASHTENAAEKIS